MIPYKNEENQNLILDLSGSLDFWYGEEIAKQNFPEEIYDNLHPTNRQYRGLMRDGERSYYKEICMQLIDKFILTREEKKLIVEELSKRERVDWDL